MEDIQFSREIERSDLQQLSKEDLIEKVIELNREKSYLLKKIAECSSQEKINQTSSSGFEEPLSHSVDAKREVGRENAGIESKIASTGNESSKKQRPFDFTRYHKRHVALKIAYLGWDFDGLASQENSENTIEHHLFAALAKACLIESRADCNYSRCGRTDKGVSAFAQVVSLDVRSNLVKGRGIVPTGNQEKVQQRMDKSNKVVEISYCHVLNKLLPSEVRVLAWAPVEEEFDARFSCLYRMYKYFFPEANVNVELMNHAAQKLVGEHDFRNFCKMDVASGVVQFDRNILSITVKKMNTSSNLEEGYEMCELVVTGSAFLWHQVRCMVAILLLIGQNLEKPEVIDWLLDIKQCPRRPQYNMASYKPLVLYDCVYENLVWEYQPFVLESLTKEFQMLWTSHSVKATMVKNLIDNLYDVSVDPEYNVGNKPALLCDKERHGKLVPWHDIKSHQCYQLFSMVPCQGLAKNHRPLKKRAMHESFESKLKSVNAKRRKAGKEEFCEKGAEA